MADNTEYLAALGALRQQSIEWASCARALGAEARKLDPAAPDHPLAVMTVREVSAELRAVCLANPGIRELLVSAIGGA